MNIIMFLAKEYKTDPRVKKEAQSLQKVGHQVTVISRRKQKGMADSEQVGGIAIHRIGNGTIAQTLPTMAMPAYYKMWWRSAARKAIQLHKEKPFEVIHCHDLDTLEAGVIVKKRKNLPLLYDSHEIYPAMVNNKTMANALYNKEIKLAQYVDQFIAATEPIRKHLLSAADKPATIIRNTSKLFIDTYYEPTDKTFSLFQLGALRKSRMMPEIVDILGRKKDIIFKIAGINEDLYSVVEERSKQYENIHFLGTIPSKEIYPETLRSHSNIALLNVENRNDKISLLNKQFEAMVCGRPIITSKHTYAGELTEKLKCGITTENTEAKIHEAVNTLKEDDQLCKQLGKNGLDAAKSQFNWENEEKKLKEIFKNI